MKRGLGHALWPALKYGVSLFCLIYVFRDVPFSELRTALAGYPISPVFGVVAVSFVAYACMGLRLSFMSKPPFSFRSTFGATLVGLAINNVLPAKAGEIAKAAWIGRSNGVPFQKTLGIVFMERFFDVNVLALLSLWFLWTVGERGTVGLFVFCLLAGWGILFLFRLRPLLAERFTKLFGGGGLHRFVSQALAGVLDNMSAAGLVRLTVSSLVVWFFYGLQMYLGLNVVAGLDLSPGVTLSVFAISSLSMLLPSSPGALGVYEAFTVAALKRYGVDPDQALAVALFAHMAQFVPVTLAGGIVFAAFPENAKETQENPR